MAPSGRPWSITALGVVFGLTLLWASAWSEAAAAAASLATHRAVYDLNLASSTSGSPPVTGASGKLEYEWADVCDGWAVRQRTRVVVLHADGSELDFGWTLNSWESKDGLSYRFFIRRFYGNGNAEDIRGEARLDGPGMGGRAVFQKPMEVTIDLPKGTVFPSYHNITIIDAAEAEKASIWGLVFDGSDPDTGLFGINVALAAAFPAGSETSLDLSLLTEVPSWRMLIAYYGLEEGASEPRYEQVARVFANGIIDELLLDYGNFALDGKLIELEELSQPDC